MAGEGEDDWTKGTSMGMALFRKFFVKKTPDRLLEISDRVYGLSLPSVEPCFRLVQHPYFRPCRLQYEIYGEV